MLGRRWVSGLGASVAIAMIMCGCSNTTARPKGVTSTSKALVTPSTTSTTVTSLPALQASTTTVANTSTCAISALSVQLTSLKVVDSNGQRASFLFTNGTRMACTMQGYPSVTLLGSSDTALPNSVNYDDFSSPAREVVLDPGGGRASFTAQWVSSGCVRQATVASRLGIAPPGSTGRLVIDATSGSMKVTVCEGLGIEPVESG